MCLDQTNHQKHMQRNMPHQKYESTRTVNASEATDAVNPQRMMRKTDTRQDTSIDSKIGAKSTAVSPRKTIVVNVNK